MIAKDHTCTPIEDYFRNAYEPGMRSSYFHYVNQGSDVDLALRRVYMDMSCPRCNQLAQILSDSDLKECKLIVNDYAPPEITNRLNEVLIGRHLNVI